MCRTIWMEEKLRNLMHDKHVQELMNDPDLLRLVVLVVVVVGNGGKTNTTRGGPQVMAHRSMLRRALQRATTSRTCTRRADAKAHGLGRYHAFHHCRERPPALGRGHTALRPHVTTPPSLVPPPPEASQPTSGWVCHRRREIAPQDHNFTWRINHG